MRALFCWLVPFTQIETRHFATGLPTSPAPQDRMQDSHNVAMTRSTDTQPSGIDTPGQEPWDTRQQWVLGQEEPGQCLLVIIHFTQGIRPQG